MPTIGEILQEARKKKGVSPEAAARAVKMKIDRLRDLEENRYDGFAAHVYVRGFLREYADYLGVDSGPLLQRFLEENPAPATRPVFEITEEQRQNSPIQRHVPPPSASFLLTTTGRTVVATAVLIVIVVALCMWWILNHMEPPPAPVEAPPPAPSSMPLTDPAPPPVQPFPAPSFGSPTNAPPAELHRGL